MNRRLDTINILGETVACASNLFKTLEDKTFWQLPLFFLYKYFLHKRTSFIDDLQRICSTGTRLHLVPMLNENSLLNASIEQSLKKMLVVVLNRLRKEPNEQFDVEPFLNLNFTQMALSIALKLTYEHMSAML
jgi:hypothetical protein